MTKGLTLFYISSKKHRFLSGFFKSIALFLIYLHVLINVAVTCGYLYISSHNYPGGHALARLHEIEGKENCKLV